MKKKRFFVDDGSGEGRMLVGDESNMELAERVLAETYVRVALDNLKTAGGEETLTLSVIEMTDSEVEALPDVG